MRNNTKKVDIIIIAVIILLIAGVFLLTVLSSDKEGAVGEVEYNTLTELNDKNIGVMMGSIYEDVVEKSLSGAKISFFDKASDMAVAVSSGKIDGFACSEVQAKRLIAENTGLKILNESPGRNDIAFAFPKTDRGRELCDRFNEFLSGITADGTLETIRGKWLTGGTSQSTVMPELSGENGTLRMATTGTTEPYTYIMDGNIVGLDIELAYSFCEKYGYGLEIDIMDFAAMIPALASSTYDLAGANITVTDEREESVYFSDSYTYNNVAVVVKGINTVPENTPLSYYNDKKIGVQTGTTFDEIVHSRLPDADISYFNTYTDMLMALNAGSIDAFGADEPIVKYMMNEDSSVSYLSEYMDSYEFGFSFPKTDKGKELCDKVSDFIRKIRADGTLAEIDGIWFGNDDAKKTIPDLEALDARNGVLKLATEAAASPFVYMSGNRVVGYEIDIAYRFCKEYGY